MPSTPRWRCRRRSRWSNPRSSGLGGGGFYLLHRQSDGFETMLDAREKAPGAASRDMYLDKAGNAIENASIAGSLAAAIPGEPAAFEYLARKYGKLPLKRACSPRFAWRASGFPLYARLQGGHALQAGGVCAFAGCGEGVLDRRRRRAGGGHHHQAAGPGEHPRGHRRPRRARDFTPAASRRIWSPACARTAASGRSADLAAYRVVERKPLVGEYHGARIVSASPPSSGGIARDRCAQYPVRLRSAPTSIPPRASTW